MVTSYTTNGLSNVTLAPNTQPVYPRTPIAWTLPLRGEVVPRIPTTEKPIQIGQAGDNGALIHGIDVQPLGDNVATELRIFTDVGTPGVSVNPPYVLLGGLSLPAVTGSTNAAAIARVSFNLFDILPAGNKGLHLEGGQTLYAALGTAVANGVIVIVRGGHY